MHLNCAPPTSQREEKENENKKGPHMDRPCITRQGWMVQSIEFSASLGHTSYALPGPDSVTTI